jgi:hypothetical protein
MIDIFYKNESVKVAYVLLCIKIVSTVVKKLLLVEGSVSKSYRSSVQ